MQFSILEISIEIKTTTAVIKNEYFLMYCMYSRAKPRGITLDMVQ